ncbi:hypothetical protein [Aliamphritea spongicola]|nr:hypothetical protein [Aliamphritea spongicola]
MIICDEVTSALDPLVADDILRLLLRLQKKHNIAYLFITHDIATVRAISDAIAVMYQGKLMRFGDKDSVLSPPLMTTPTCCSLPYRKWSWAGWKKSSAHAGWNRQETDLPSLGIIRLTDPVSPRETGPVLIYLTTGKPAGDTRLNMVQA